MADKKKRKGTLVNKLKEGANRMKKVFVPDTKGAWKKLDSKLSARKAAEEAMMNSMRRGSSVYEK